MALDYKRILGKTMKVVMTLKSGLIIELPIKSLDDLECIHHQMESYKSFFSWNNRIWVKKKEVASYELVNEELKNEQTI